MHILIGLITAVATLLFAMDRVGIDIGWLNPWAWRRRRRWIKQLNANPAFNLDSPMEAMALLLLATARIDGDLSAEEKSELRHMFEAEFKQSPESASSLLSSSTYLLADGEAVFKRPDQVLEKSMAKFSAEQKSSSIELLQRVAAIGGGPSPAQRDFVSNIVRLLSPEKPTKGWQ
jgi:uncharacterized tellurite resistance protein B-like protein